MRVIYLAALCLVSGALGAGIDHYKEKLSPLARVWEFAKSNASQLPQKTSALNPAHVEILGNRVRCDVRFQELKCPIAITGRSSITASAARSQSES